MQDPSHAELLARLRQAEDAVRARDDFLAIAAHELRSPIHALALRLAALERMAAQAGQPMLQQELQRARRGVDRYVRRAITLLDLSRLQAGVLRPAPAWVRAGELAANVVEDYGDEANFHGVSLQAEVGVDCSGYWDARMIEQVLGNLVSNALKYGGGTPVLVRASLDGADCACLEVSDRGSGIPPAHRARIFEKFERVMAISRDQAGFGLGLWITGRMVAAHHGTIEVTDRPGGGALFRVRLPLQALSHEHKDTSR